MSSKFRHRAVLLGLGTGGSSESSLDLPWVWGPRLRGHGSFQSRASASLLWLMSVATSRLFIFLASHHSPFFLSCRLGSWARCLILFASQSLFRRVWIFLLGKVYKLWETLEIIGTPLPFQTKSSLTTSFFSIPLTCWSEEIQSVVLLKYSTFWRAWVPPCDGAELSTPSVLCGWSFG